MHPHSSKGSRKPPRVISDASVDSRPTLSLCMTGRGESLGNEKERGSRGCGEGEKHCSPQDEERSLKAGTG